MKEKTLEERVAKIIATVCDQGQYGFASCGHCNTTLSEPYYEHTKCPSCDYIFIGITMGPSFGGSDF